MIPPGPIVPALSRIPEVHVRRLQLLGWLDDDEWLKPMDLSSWDASYHSGDLRRMAKLGLVEIGGYRSFQRRVNKYRRTKAGKNYLRAMTGT